MSASAVSLFLALQRQQSPDWIEGVMQALVVLIFLILPGIKSLLDRKRKGGPGGPSSAPQQQRRTELEREGGDMWRELLGGGERTAPRPPQAPPVARAPRPQASQPAHRPPPLAPLRPAQAQEANPQLEQRPVRIDPDAADVLRELHRQRAAESERRRAQSAELERAQAERPVERGRASEQALGGLDARVEGSAVGRFEPSMAAAALPDPATLDDELGKRWGGAPEAHPGADARAALLGGVLDWRRAVLLSEVLSPPLALRGTSTAWPGPPASLAG